MIAPKKYTCGTCHWFERGPNPPAKGQPQGGSCMVNPPVPALTMQQVNTLHPSGPQSVPAVMGILPQTLETYRCSKWHASGATFQMDKE